MPHDMFIANCTVRTVVLMTPEEVDAAAQLHPDYTPPSAG